MCQKNGDPIAPSMPSCVVLVLMLHNIIQAIVLIANKKMWGESNSVIFLLQTGICICYRIWNQRRRCDRSWEQSWQGTNWRNNLVFLMTFNQRVQTTKRRMIDFISLYFLRWRDTVHSSTFNHRLVLADALFRMGEKQLALDIISGM